MIEKSPKNKTSVRVYQTPIAIPPTADERKFNIFPVHEILRKFATKGHHKNTCRDLHLIIKSFNKNADFQVQGYADVQQVYNKTFKPCEQAIVILKWMIDVTLQLNPRKTLIMVIVPSSIFFKGMQI